MYHTIGTVLAVTLFYLLSLLFYRAGFYSKLFHRGVWNSVLAVTFILTVAGGLFLALQANYKWDIPLIKTFLKWHVEAGIVFAATGIFHFIWNFPWFGKAFRGTEITRESIQHTDYSKPVIISNLLVTGFAGTAIQILLIREMMNISGGYEMNTGIFLGSWLIASAAGSFIAGKSDLNDLKKINITFTLSAVVSISLMMLFSRLFLKTGESPSFLINMIFTFFILVPFCTVSGFIFIKLIRIARQSNFFSPGKSFSIETMGGIVAGIIITILTSGLINTYQLILSIILLSVTYTLLTYSGYKKRINNVIKVVVTLLFSAIIIFKPDNIFRQIFLPVISVTDSRDTPYGNITTGEYGGELSVYYNHRLLNYQSDAVEREENIHYALLQTDNPQKVLLISGSLRSHLPEIAKYPVKKVFYIERDPALARMEKSGLMQGKIDLVTENADAYTFIRNTVEVFDAVILLLPPPSTLSLNRFYTKEFFAEIKSRLSPGGVFMCSTSQSDVYMNDESVNLLSSVYNSMSAVFSFVKPISGNKLYLIASDKEVSVSICSLSGSKQISNTYVNCSYLSDDLIEMKSREIISQINSQIPGNEIMYPSACFHFQSYNISRNIGEKVPAIILMVLAFAMPVLAVKRRNLVMYYCASSLAGFEIIILVCVQLAAGNVYQLTAIVIAAMMAGLAAGSGINSSFPAGLSIKAKSLILLVYFILFAFMTDHLLSIENKTMSSVLIVSMILFPAFITGQIFRDLTSTDTDGASTSPAYSADLAGSALGFILISGVALPALGIKASVFLLSILVFTGFLFGTTRNKY